MTTLTEFKYVADLVKEEPFKQVSRILGTISSAAAGIVSRFTVLGIVTASGKYLPYNPGASDGTQTAAAILIGASGGPNGGDADATSADVTNAVLLGAGPAVVDTAFLIWGAGVTTQAQKNAAYASLYARGIAASAPA
jgi:hypothetical protein